MTTAFGIIILVVAVGLLIAGYTSKALYAVAASFIGSLGLAVLFDGYAKYLFWAGVIAIFALLLSKALARIVVAIGLILALVAGLAGADYSSLKFWDDNKPATTSDASDFGPQRDPDDCVDKYNVILDKNEGERVLSAGLPDGTAEQKRDYMVTKAQHDPRVLQLAWNTTPAGIKNPVTVQELVDNGCYSEKGRDLYQQTKGIYEAAAVVLEDAPAIGVNTGVANGTPFQEAGNITGDRSGIGMTFYGTKHKIWIMDRCGNIVTTTPIPKVPPKPQPEPTPEQPQPTPTRPTPTCPDGKPFNPDGTCPKDPSKDVNNNPAVPDPVKGPGTTPVGTDPGPATPVYDSPTGCNGPCPRPSDQPPAPRPVATERPQGDPNGGSGNGGATPGPGPTDDSDADQTTEPEPERDNERPDEGTTGTPPPDGPQDCGTGNPDDC